jgi:glucose/mannose-6-phosphate isomerase
MNRPIPLLEKWDRQGMHRHISHFPQQLFIPPMSGPLKDLAPPSNVMVVGVGGSAIGGEILRGYMSSLSTCPVHVVRGYALPQWADTCSLVVAVSYSGNTKETFMLANEALGKGIPLIAITQGGKLKDLAERKGIPLLLLPLGGPPRTALGFIFSSLLGVAQALGLLPPQEGAVSETRLLLGTMGEELSPVKGGGMAFEIAMKLQRTIPLLYASSPILESVALRWKEQLNENSKTPAFLNSLPELGHNEIMAWENNSYPFHVIILRDKEGPKLQTRSIEALKDILKGRGEATEVKSRGKGVLARLLSLSYLGDWVSYYLALLKEVDPTPIELIQELKKRLEA